MSQRLILAAGPWTTVIGTFHIAPTGRLVSLATRLLGVWLRPSLKRFDRMLSVSIAAQAFAKVTFRMASDISPNVIEYDKFHKALPLPAYDDAVTTILFLGRLVPRKGCQILLAALNKLAKQPDLPPFRAVICGKGQLEARLRDYVRDNGLTDKVEFTGFVSETDKPRYYASADIAVFPSSGGESFGIVLLEAMASGHAVVLAGDNPGYRSVLADQPELLFNPHDARALAEKLAYYLKQPQKRAFLQTWGTDYTKGFDINLIGMQLMAIYQQELRKRRQA